MKEVKKTEKPRVVISLGGNMLQPFQGASAEEQKKQIAKVASLLVDVSEEYELVLNHGAGPQIGNLAWHENVGATEMAPAMPLETVIAMTQGQIGYWLMQALTNEMTDRGQTPHIATLIGQVVVDYDDPAFDNPTKQIGPFYTKEEADAVAAEHRYTMKEIRPGEWRRVVASPQPVDIVEKKVIQNTVAAGALVIATSSGGIPVYYTEKMHHLKGIDAVVDKDYTAEKMAELIDADIFVTLTAVPNAYINFGQPNQEAIEKTTAKAVQEMLAEDQFGTGSMAPKMDAAARFAASKPGRWAIVTEPDLLKDALKRKAGTIVDGDKRA